MYLKYSNSQQLKQKLDELNIIYESYTHPALYTCKDADHYAIERPGTRLKNLFLRDNYGRRHFLLITSFNQTVDLKKLTKFLKVSRLGFASQERLKKYLGVNPGCVSLLTLINDPEHQVELLIDSRIWHSEQFHCHPLINTETLVIEKRAIEMFLEFTGHQPTLIIIPDTKDTN